MLRFSWNFACSSIRGWRFHFRKSFFKIWAKKGILGQIWPKFWECSDFPEILHVAQFEGADFNSGIHFSKFGQKGDFRPNLAQILRMLRFSWKFACSTIRGCWFQIWQSFFKIGQKRGILGQIWPECYKWSDFSENLHVAHTIRGCWFQIWELIFEIWPKKGILGQIWPKYYKCSDFP